MRTLYEWAGGTEALDRVIHAFCDKSGDLRPGFSPGVMHAPHRGHVAAGRGEVLGGPAPQTEPLGAYEHTRAEDRDLGRAAGRPMRLSLLRSPAVDDAGLPDDPAFSSALGVSLQSGTRLARHNYQPGASVAPHAPVARRVRGEARPNVR